MKDLTMDLYVHVTDEFKREKLDSIFTAKTMLIWVSYYMYQVTPYDMVGRHSKAGKFAGLVRKGVFYGISG